MATGTQNMTTYKSKVLSHTPNNTTTFLRGDNTWSNVLTDNLSVGGDLVIDGNLQYNSNNANKLVWTDTNKNIKAANHYASATKVAINSTNEPTQNFYVNGSSRFAIGASDTSSDKNFIIGSPGSRYLSIGASGLQAYDFNDANSTLYLNYFGGNINIGQSNLPDSTSHVTLYTNNTISSGNIAIEAYNNGSFTATNTKYLHAMRYYCPNVNANTVIAYTAGVRASEGDHAFFAFAYDGPNSNYNHINFGIYNHNDIFRIYKQGNVAIGPASDKMGPLSSGDSANPAGTDTANYKLYVNGTSCFTGYIKTTDTYPNIRGNGTGVYFSIDDTWDAKHGNVCIEANVMRPSSASSGAGMTLGASGNRWGKLYVGTADSYGSTGQPIYWNAGVPAAIDWHIGNSGVGEHNANNITYNMCGYYTSNGPAKDTTNTFQTTDGAIYAQAYSSSWVGQIAQDYRTGALAVRAKNNGTWTSWVGIPKMSVETYPALLPPSGTNNWIKIGTSNTSYGILPSQSGGAGSGHNYIGTSSWYWKYAYIDQIYGYLNGNISGSAATASKLTNIGSGDLASSTATWRRVWFSYNDNVTGRPAYDDNFVYQTSTQTLKVANLSGNAATASAVKDYNNSTLVKFGYSTSGMTSVSWVGAWDASVSGEYRLRAISPQKLRNSMGLGDTTGALPVANGGTGKTSWTQWGVVYASATTTLANTAQGTSGYVLTAKGAAAPAWDTCKPYLAASTSKAYIVGTTATGTSHRLVYYNASVYTSGSVLHGAAWNDYAEYRETKEEVEPGRCVIEVGDDSLTISTKRLERGCEIVSDTFGFAIGETDDCKTPIAASGRVLAYPYESREEFAKHIGWPVCSGPDGTVSIMTEEEEIKYPSRIIGTISAVPDYKTWGSGNIAVNGRVWIRIR